MRLCEVFDQTYSNTPIWFENTMGHDSQFTINNRAVIKLQPEIYAKYLTLTAVTQADSF
jgi:hypothetical protein